MKILLIGNLSRTRQELANAFEASGHSVIWAPNVDGGLASPGLRPFDALIVEWELVAAAPAVLVRRVHAVMEAEHRSPLLIALVPALPAAGLEAVLDSGFQDWIGPGHSPTEVVFRLEWLNRQRQVPETAADGAQGDSILRRAVSAASMVLFAIDPTGRFTLSEGGNLANLGLKPGQVVGRSVFDVYADLPEVVEQINKTLAGEQVISRAVVDGRTFYTRYTPDLDPSGQRRGLLGFSTDITDVKGVEDRLRTSEAGFRSLIEHSPDGMLVVRDLRIAYANPRATQLVGHSCDGNLSSAHLSDVFPPTVLDRLQRRLAQKMAPGDAFQMAEIALPGRGQMPLIIEIQAVCVVFDGREAMLLKLHDLTERRQLETELRHAQKLESVGRLASGIAHEINTPIQFVGDSAHFLSDAFQCLNRVLAEYRTFVSSQAGDPVLEAQRHALVALEDDEDLPYIEEEFPRAIDRVLDGVQRVSQIVGAMKRFAHPETRSKTPADINAALLDTVTVARNEIKYVADVETTLQTLPMIKCHLS
ncbi:MAG: PAS domain-containing protein, partial [Myxococcales bacterium]